MKIYNPKEWSRAILYLHKSDTFIKLFPFSILITIYSFIVAYFMQEYFDLNERSWLEEITTVHSLLGFVLSMLLVFRTNSAYDRWWEGRKQWGTLTNISRSFAMKVNGILPEDDKENRDFFRKAIPLFSKALFSFLRSDYSKFMLDEEKYYDMDLIAKHGPNQVMNLVYQRINNLYKTGEISGEELIILDSEFREFNNVCGACERIKNTLIPYSYSSFIKKFILLYIITLPMGLVFSMGYFVVLAVPFIFYVVVSLELIAESIETPFATNSDSLPIEQITMNIEKHIAEIIK